MAVTLHHLIVPAKDKLASAQLFAEIFGLTVKPSAGRFAQVPVDEHLTIDFADDEHTRGILHLPPKQGTWLCMHSGPVRCGVSSTGSGQVLTTGLRLATGC